MAKLYFRYGTVSSAKTLNLLAVFHNYGQQGKKAILIKPKTDNRFGASVVKSRAGLAVEADYVLEPNSRFPLNSLEKIHCILVDEVQFFSREFIDSLRQITIDFQIPVICYGLRTDFRTKSFQGSLRLMEIADTIEEIKTTCAFCSKKAVFNLKKVGSHFVTEGPQIEMGAEEKYLPACSVCYAELTGDKRKDHCSKSKGQEEQVLQ